MEKIYELKEILLERKKEVIIVSISILVITIISILIIILNTKDTSDTSNDTTPLVEVTTSQEEVVDDTEECLVTVDIKGEVKNPGAYQVSCDMRVNDILNQAELTDNSDTSVLNLSKKVFDEMVIIVYSKEEVKNFTETKAKEVEVCEKCVTYNQVENNACITEDKILDNTTDTTDSTTTTDITTTEENNSSQSTTLISINTATLAELTTLPGIGNSKAQNIIDYRTTNGPFTSIEDIKNVKGIGDSIFEKIKSLITL